MTKSKVFLVIRKERVCVEVREYKDGASAIAECDRLTVEGLFNANVFWADSKATVEADPACSVGGALDKRWRDEFDFSSDFSEEGWD